MATPVMSTADQSALTQRRGYVNEESGAQNLHQGSGPYSNQAYNEQGPGQYNSREGYTNQAPGQYTNQAPGQYTNQGPGPYTNQGPGQYTNQGPGQYTSQGSGQYTNQGSGPYTNQGSGPYTNQGSGQYTNQGSGPYANQAPAPYSNSGKGYGELPGSYAAHGQPQNTEGQYYAGPGKVVDKDHYIDSDGEIRKKRRGGRLAVLLGLCWCVTWPCHGPCCGGL